MGQVFTSVRGSAFIRRVALPQVQPDYGRGISPRLYEARVQPLLRALSSNGRLLARFGALGDQEGTGVLPPPPAVVEWGANATSAVREKLRMQFADLLGTFATAPADSADARDAVASVASGAQLSPEQPLSAAQSTQASRLQTFLRGDDDKLEYSPADARADLLSLLAVAITGPTSSEGTGQPRPAVEGARPSVSTLLLAALTMMGPDLCPATDAAPPAGGIKLADCLPSLTMLASLLHDGRVEDLSVSNPAAYASRRQVRSQSHSEEEEPVGALAPSAASGGTALHSIASLAPLLPASSLPSDPASTLTALVDAAVTERESRMAHAAARAGKREASGKRPKRDARRIAAKADAQQVTRLLSQAATLLDALEGQSTRSTEAPRAALPLPASETSACGVALLTVLAAHSSAYLRAHLHDDGRASGTQSGGLDDTDHDFLAPATSYLHPQPSVLSFDLLSALFDACTRSACAYAQASASARTSGSAGASPLAASLQLSLLALDAVSTIARAHLLAAAHRGLPGDAARAASASHAGDLSDPWCAGTARAAGAGAGAGAAAPEGINLWAYRRVSADSGPVPEPATSHDTAIQRPAHAAAAGPALAPAAAAVPVAHIHGARCMARTGSHDSDAYCTLTASLESAAVTVEALHRQLGQEKAPTTSLAAASTDSAVVSLEPVAGGSNDASDSAATASSDAAPSSSGAGGGTAAGEAGDEDGAEWRKPLPRASPHSWRVARSLRAPGVIAVEDRADDDEGVTGDGGSTADWGEDDAATVAPDTARGADDGVVDAGDEPREEQLQPEAADVDMGAGSSSSSSSSSSDAAAAMSVAASTNAPSSSAAASDLPALLGLASTTAARVYRSALLAWSAALPLAFSTPASVHTLADAVLTECAEAVVAATQTSAAPSFTELLLERGRLVAGFVASFPQTSHGVLLSAIPTSSAFDHGSRLREAVLSAAFMIKMQAKEAPTSVSGVIASEPGAPSAAPSSSLPLLPLQAAVGLAAALEEADGRILRNLWLLSQHGRADDVAPFARALGTLHSVLLKPWWRLPTAGGQADASLSRWAPKGPLSLSDLSGPAEPSTAPIVPSPMEGYVHAGDVIDLLLHQRPGAPVQAAAGAGTDAAAPGDVHLHLLPFGQPAMAQVAKPTGLAFDPARHGDTLTLCGGGAGVRGTSGGRAWGVALGDKGFGAKSGLHTWDVTLVRLPRGCLVSVGVATRSASLSQTLGMDELGWGFAMGAPGASFTTYMQHGRAAKGLPEPSAWHEGMTIRITLDTDSDVLRVAIPVAPQSQAPAGSPAPGAADPSRDAPRSVDAQPGAFSSPLARFLLPADTATGATSAASSSGSAASSPPSGAANIWPGLEARVFQVRHAFRMMTKASRAGGAAATQLFPAVALQGRDVEVRITAVPRSTGLGAGQSDAAAAGADSGVDPASMYPAAIPPSLRRGMLPVTSTDGLAAVSCISGRKGRAPSQEEIESLRGLAKVPSVSELTRLRTIIARVLLSSATGKTASSELDSEWQTLQTLVKSAAYSSCGYAGAAFTTGLPESSAEALSAPSTAAPAPLLLAHLAHLLQDIAAAPSALFEVDNEGRAALRPHAVQLLHVLRTVGAWGLAKWTSETACALLQPLATLAGALAPFASEPAPALAVDGTWVLTAHVSPTVSVTMGVTL